MSKHKARWIELDYTGDGSTTNPTDALWSGNLPYDSAQSIKEKIDSIGGGGSADGSGTAGEAITTGQLVTKDYNGTVWAATGSNQFRYAVGVALNDAAVDASVSYVSSGEVDVLTDTENPYDHTSTFFLSIVEADKGKATPLPPTPSDGQKLRQVIGFAVENRNDTTGMTKIKLQLQSDWVWI